MNNMFKRYKWLHILTFLSIVFGGILYVFFNSNLSTVGMEPIKLVFYLINLIVFPAMVILLLLELYSIVFEDKNKKISIIFVSYVYVIIIYTVLYSVVGTVVDFNNNVEYFYSGDIDVYNSGFLINSKVEREWEFINENYDLPENSDFEECVMLVPTNKICLSIFENLYFSITTISTLGYGDYQPGHIIGKLLVISEVLTGQVLLIFAIVTVKNE